MKNWCPIKRTSFLSNQENSVPQWATETWQLGRPYTTGSRVDSTIQRMTKVVLFSVHQTSLYGKHQIYNTLSFVHSAFTCLSILYSGMHLPSSNYKIECKQHPWKIHSFELSTKPEADNDIFI